MQLTKNSKNLIKIVKQLNARGIEYPTSDDLNKNMDLSHNEILSAAKYLKENNFAHVDFGTYRDDVPAYITLIELTHEGSHYAELKWLEVRSFLFKSIIIPIVVSTITSVLLYFLNF